MEFHGYTHTSQTRIFQRDSKKCLRNPIPAKCPTSKYDKRNLRVFISVMAKTIGVLGGGQLGCMLIEAARRRNLKVITLGEPLLGLPKTCGRRAGLQSRYLSCAKLNN